MALTVNDQRIEEHTETPLPWFVSNESWPGIYKIKALKETVNKAWIFHPVTPPGFEPRQTESESVVLPLYYGALKTQM